MHSPTILLLSLIAIAAALVAVLVVKPDVTQRSGGKVLAFLTLFLMPGLLMAMGFSSELERSQSTDFCLSCHVMQKHGRSLYVDDASYLAAAHYQNRRVPTDKACYTCHTNYAMFGGYKAKLSGLRHLYVQYFGTPHNPIKLYGSYNNRECLHCHAGGRSFEESDSHTDGATLLADIKSNKTSCVSSDCHSPVHNASQLDTVTFWKGTM